MVATTGRDRSARRRGRAGALVAVAAALALGACGGTQYAYVKNDADKTYLRMPRSWEVLEAPALAAAGETLPAPWQRVLDAADTPNLAHAEEVEPQAVLGKLTVFYVSARTADSLSSEDMRAAVSPLQSDPLALAEANDATKGALKDFNIESRKGGLRGSRVVYEVTTQSGASVVFDQTTLIDPSPYPNPNGSGTAMFKVYALSLHCVSACYEKAKSDIDDVVTSWTVDP